MRQTIRGCMTTLQVYRRNHLVAGRRPAGPRCRFHQHLPGWSWLRTGGAPGKTISARKMQSRDHQTPPPPASSQTRLRERRAVRGASVAALRNNHVGHTTSREDAWRARDATTREGHASRARHAQTSCTRPFGYAIAQTIRQERIQPTINVIASLRSGVATMARMGGYVE